jgi:hypothetical protein
MKFYDAELMDDRRIMNWDGCGCRSLPCGAELALAGGTADTNETCQRFPGGVEGKRNKTKKNILVF